MPEMTSAESFEGTMDREIFEAGGRVYLLHHVLSAAAFRDEIDVFFDQFQDKLTCHLYAEEEGFEIGEDELQSSYDMFRYEHSIFTVEDTLTWLSDRGMVDEDIVRYLERIHWHNRFATILDDIRKAYIPQRSSFAVNLWPELILTGFLKSVSIPLAWRVVASIKVTPDKIWTDRMRSTFHQKILSGTGSVDNWLKQHFCSREWLSELIEMEVCFRMISEKVLSHERCMKIWQDRKLDFVRFFIQRAIFASSSEAKEVYQCVLQDGEAFETVIKRIGIQSEAKTYLFEDVPEKLCSRFLSALPEDILIEEGEEGEYILYRIMKKFEPGLEDPDVRARVESFLLYQEFEPLVERGIRWLVPME